MIIGIMEIDVLIEAGFEEYIDAGWLKLVAERVLTIQNTDVSAELSLVISPQEKMRRLNLSYLGEDEPTDVLSFPMLPEQAAADSVAFVAPPDGVQHLGEIIISYPQAVIQARERQHPVKREIATLIIHGTLHLLGYDHDTPERERERKAREATILSDIEGVIE